MSRPTLTAEQRSQGCSVSDYGPRANPRYRIVGCRLPGRVDVVGVAAAATTTNPIAPMAPMPVFNTNTITATLQNVLGGPAVGPTASMPPMAPMPSFIENVGGLIGRAVTGGSPTGDAIGSFLGSVAGNLIPGRANTPVTAMTSIVPAVVGTAGRAMMGGMMGELGAMGMRALMGGGMRYPRGTARALRSLVPAVGLESAAGALGLTLSEAARLYSRRRRGRGISAADVRRTYRVLNFTSRIRSHLSKSGICRKR